MLFSPWVRACVACCLLFAGQMIRAASVPLNPDGELTLAQAIAAALRSNPELRASSYEISAAQARMVQAGTRPNPQAGIELENFAGRGTLRGVDALETTLSLSQVIELGDKRPLRRSAAQAGVDLVAIEQRAHEIDLLAEVTRKFIDVAAAQERARLAREASALAEQTLGVIGTRVEAGRSPEAERSRARIAVIRAQIEQRQADSQLRSARYALAATWGSPEPAFKGSRADLFDLGSAQPFNALMQRLELTPEFLRFASASRLREAELRLAQAHSRPNLGVSLGVRRLQESGDVALVASISVPLQIHDRNQGAIREAQVRATQADAQRDAAQVRARASLFALYQAIDATREQIGTLRNEAVPQAQLALEQTRTGYERGRFSFLELASAQQELLALRAAAIDAAADYHRLRAEIERLTSEALSQPSSSN